MGDEIRTLLKRLVARHVPGYEVRSVAWMGEGLNNVAYEVNGELVVRVNKEADPARRGRAVRREADLLLAVAEASTLPVPVPVFTDDGAGVLAYRKLPGFPLMDRPVADPARLASSLAPVLGTFLGELHRTPSWKVEHLVARDLYPLPAWREDAERNYRKVSEMVSGPSRCLVEDFLARTPPDPSSAEAFCHNDLGAEHVLVDGGADAITGVIDWTDAAITDPARDLALIHRDLGPEVFDATLAHYERPCGDADRERAVFYARCKLLEDLAHGAREPGAGRYAETALANLVRTFAWDFP